MRALSKTILGLVAFLALGVLGAHLPAQSPLFRALEEPLTAEAGAPLISFDVDGDGDQDLVCSSGVHLNDGQARFTAVSGSPSFGFARSGAVRAVDLDGNGSLDLVGFSSQGTVLMFRNTGGGFFAAATPGPTLALGAVVVSIAAGDVDGDGDQDLVLSLIAQSPHNYIPLPAALWLNNGSATFTNAPTSLPSTPPLAGIVHLLDIDHDGDLDVVGLNAEYTATARLVAVNTAGTFAYAPTNLGTAIGCREAAVADCDGDGFLDLVIARQSSLAGNGIEVQLTRPGGVFASTFLALAGSPAILLPVDLDGDGRPDLVTSAGAALDLRLVSPSGAVSAPIQTLSLQASGLPASVARGDFDGDGDIDIAFLAFRQEVYFNTGQNALVPHVQAMPPSFVGAHGFGDLNADGTPDVLALTASAGTTQLVTGMNDGNARFQLGPQTIPTSLGVTDWIAFDADGDGDLDVMKPGPAFGTVSEYFVNSGGTWSLAATIPAGGDTWTAHAGDLDGDGDLDLALARRPYFYNGSPAVPCMILWNGNGGTAWTPALLPGANTFAGDLALGDADGDGDLDIFEADAAGSLATQSRLFVNLGGGVFVQSTSFAPGTAVGVAVGDLDGDGDNDAVFGGQVWRNVGSGTFALAWNILGGDLGRIRLADVDEDGDLDVIGNAAWVQTLGNLTFAPPQTFGSGSGAATVAVPPATPFGLRAPDVLDLDRDGDLDILLGTGRIYSNTLRHLSRGDLPRPGRPASLEIFGPPNAAYLLAASGGSVSTPLGSAGTLLVDPNLLGFTTTGFIPANGPATFGAIVPAGASYVGVTIYCQAWIPAAGRLTNLEPMTILSL